MGINVDFGGDPVQSDVEHVVVLFANGQDVAAQAQLELFVKMYPGAEGSVSGFCCLICCKPLAIVLLLRLWAKHSLHSTKFPTHLAGS